MHLSPDRAAASSIQNGAFLLSGLPLPCPIQIQRQRRADSQQIACEGRNIQHRIFIIQRYIGLLVKGARRTMDEPVQDICNAAGGGRIPLRLMRSPKTGMGRYCPG